MQNAKSFFKWMKCMLLRGDVVDITMRHFHSGVPSSYKHITANATTQYADLRVYWEECIVLSSSSSESSPASCPPTHWSNFAFDFATMGSTMHAFTLNACGSVTSGARDTYASMITVPAIFQLPSLHLLEPSHRYCKPNHVLQHGLCSSC